MLCKWRNVELKINIWIYFNFSYLMIEFRSNRWNCFSSEKHRLNCLKGEKCRLNCCGEQKCWSNEGILNSKSEPESILICSIRWSSFDLDSWNCFSGESTKLFKWQKCQLNCCNRDKCWSNGRDLSSKSGFEFILSFSI